MDRNLKNRSSYFEWRMSSKAEQLQASVRRSVKCGLTGVGLAVVAGLSSVLEFNTVAKVAGMAGWVPVTYMALNLFEASWVAKDYIFYKEAREAAMRRAP